MRRFDDLDGVDAVRGWLLDPAADRGIHLADEGSGSTFRSYRSIASAARVVAAALRADGVGAGDGVCVLMPTDFDCVAAVYGVWARGAVVTPITPPTFADLDEYATHVAGILDQAAPSTVLTIAGLVDLVRTAVDRSAVPGVRVVALDTVLADAAAVDDGADEPLGEPGRYALLQFTSGSSGTPRGVRITWENIAANTAMIARTLDWRPGEAMASWLPLYHDMGLIGGFLTTVALQEDLHLMRPDQFIRDPARWLRAMTVAAHTMAPSFALGYVAHRVRPETIADWDLTGFRSLAVGAEPVDVPGVQAFCRLVGPRGFAAERIVPAYGLAENTLMVTASGPASPLVVVQPQPGSLRFGEKVDVRERAVFDPALEYRGERWIVGLGRPDPAAPVRIVGTDGAPLPDGLLGEVVVAGDSASDGYTGDGAGSTRIDGGEVHTGDAGFLLDGELFVLGRMATSLKVRGRSVFMEDVEAAVAAECSLVKGRLAAVALPESGSQGVALFAEFEPGPWIAEARTVIRGMLGPAQTVTVVTGPRGTILKTSSGKPRRRLLWERYLAGALDGVLTHEADGTTAAPHAPTLSGERVAELLDTALESVRIPAECSVLFEGSLAEGFGNEGSDVDFLVIAAGDGELPTLPSVLFGDGRRLEVRTRTVGQIRAQLEKAARAAAQDRIEDLTEDLLNRCQRYLRSTPVRRSAAVDAERLDEILALDDFARILQRWWSSRVEQVMRHVQVLRLLGEDEEARGWARDALVQAAKAWGAGHDETYLETKWLPRQLDRAEAGGHDAPTARIRAVTALLDDGAPAWWAELDALIGALAPGDWTDPDEVRLARVDGVTTWDVAGRVHVVRGGREVFALSDDAAKAWRTVVFRRPLSRIAQAPNGVDAEGHRGALADFLRHGLVGLTWGRAAIRPAFAMCEPADPSTPSPYTGDPVLSLAGANRPDDGTALTLAPLPADRFATAALDLTWANVVAENAREDLVGAVKSGQAEVAAVAAHRLIAMCTRMVLAAYAVTPLPPDVAPVRTLRRAIPDTAAHKRRVLAAVETAAAVDVAAAVVDGDALDGVHVLDALLGTVRDVIGGLRFPASFDSREQWRRTLEVAYDWVRIGHHLGVEPPLAEAQDLLSTGGAQPHAAPDREDRR